MPGGGRRWKTLVSQSGACRLDIEFPPVAHRPWKSQTARFPHSHSADGFPSLSVFKPTRLAPCGRSPEGEVRKRCCGTPADHYRIWNNLLLALPAVRYNNYCPASVPLAGFEASLIGRFSGVPRGVERASLDLSKDLDLIRNVFAAKEVPLALLAEIDRHREFHRQDWPAVEFSAGHSVREFDFYFDFVLGEVSRLKALWI